MKIIIEEHEDTVSVSYIGKGKKIDRLLLLTLATAETVVDCLIPNLPDKKVREAADCFADDMKAVIISAYEDKASDHKSKLTSKEAAAPAGKLQISNPDKWKENGSFLAACALWGAGADVMALPSLTFAADQVAIDPVHKRAKNPNDPPTVAGYRLHSALTVDKLLRAEDGHIIGVQLLQGERKVVWQAE